MIYSKLLWSDPVTVCHQRQSPYEPHLVTWKHHLMERAPPEELLKLNADVSIRYF